MKAYVSEKALLEAELAEGWLSESLALSVAFYDVVKERDEVFFQKIMDRPGPCRQYRRRDRGFTPTGLHKIPGRGRLYITITPDLATRR